jgi:hypothetical protein
VRGTVIASALTAALAVFLGWWSVALPAWWFDQVGPGKNLWEAGRDHFGAWSLFLLLASAFLLGATCAARRSWIFAAFVGACVALAFPFAACCEEIANPASSFPPLREHLRVLALAAILGLTACLGRSLRRTAQFGARHRTVQ